MYTIYGICIIITILIYYYKKKQLIKFRNSGFIYHLTTLKPEFLKILDTSKFNNIIFKKMNLFKRVSFLTRQGEGIGYETLKENNINCYNNLYNNHNFINYITDIVGEKVYVCPEWDKHRIGIYKYCEENDHIDWHYDKSFYKGTRYTVLIALQNCNIENKCELEYIVNNNTYIWDSVKYNMIIFHGDKLYHRVTKMKKTNKDRIILTLQYVTDKKINFIYKYIDNLKNKLVYKF